MSDITTLADLTPDPENARKHNPRNIGMIVDALHEVGAARSIVIDEDGRILAGNGTYDAAGEAGIHKVRVVDADGEELIAVRRRNLTPEQKKRLALFDNRTGELAEWDAEQLARELEAGTDLDGVFSDDELTTLLESLTDGPTLNGDPDDVPDIPDEPITQRGDLIVLGRHRLLCADCTERPNVDRLMDGTKADMGFTDPPYGVAVSGAGGHAIAGDLGNVAITGFFPLAVEAIQPGRALYLCGGSSNVPLYFKLYEWHCQQLPKLIVWDKTHFVLRHSDYHAQFELIFYGWTPGGSDARSRWFGDRTQTDIWQIKRDNATDYEHTTQKPVELAAKAIQNSSPATGVVYEPFAGSGSTLVACEQSGRACFCMEIDPRYCDVIVSRFESLTGQTAQRPERVTV